MFIEQGVTKKLDQYKKSFPKSMKNSLLKRKISTPTIAKRNARNFNRKIQCGPPAPSSTERAT